MSIMFNQICIYIYIYICVLLQAKRISEHANIYFTQSRVISGKIHSKPRRQPVYVYIYIYIYTYTHTHILLQARRMSEHANIYFT